MATTERKARLYRQREQELLDAAATLYREQEWHAVPVDAIAAQAGVAKGTVYLHVRTKEEVGAKLALRYLKRLAGAWSRVPGEPAGRERLLGLLAAARQVATQFPGQFAVLRDTLTTRAPFRPELAAELETAWRPLESALGAALAASAPTSPGNEITVSRHTLLGVIWALLQAVSTVPPLAAPATPLPDPAEVVRLILR